MAQRTTERASGGSPWWQPRSQYLQLLPFSMPPNLGWGADSILEPEYIFSKFLKLYCMSSHHPLRSMPSAQHTPFQTLELIHSSISPPHTRPVPESAKTRRGHLIRTAHPFYTWLIKVRAEEKTKAQNSSGSPKVPWELAREACNVPVQTSAQDM